MKRAPLFDVDLPRHFARYADLTPGSDSLPGVEIASARMSLALRALLVVALPTLTACHGPEDEAREQFSASLSCPQNAVALRTRTELDTYSLRYNGDPPKPSQEVAADPQRLAVWQADNQKSKDFWANQGPVVYELKGCGHEALYVCTTSRSTSRGSTGLSFGCTDTAYPPGAPLWDPAAKANLRPVPPPPPPPGPPKRLTMATLATVPLDASRKLGPIPLDAPPIRGDWATFDPVANLEWASSIATAWSPDAKLWRLFWSPNEEGTMDGTANLSKAPNSVHYEYASATRGDLAIELRAHWSGLPGPQVTDVDISMRPHQGAMPQDPLPAPTCPVTRIFATLRPKTGVDSAFNVQLEGAGKAAYWHTTHYHGSGIVKTIDDYFDATTCAIEHPKK